MFIIHGKTQKRKDRGIVADYCPVCGRFQPFSITEIYSVVHVYFIPLGEGTLAGATRKCCGCFKESACNSRAYQSIMADREARLLPIEQLLGQTNPALMQHWHKEQQRQQHIQQLEASGQKMEAQLAAVMDRLRRCAGDNQVTAQYEDRLRGWDRLGPAPQGQLLDEIVGYVEGQEQKSQAGRLVLTAAQQAPQGAGCLPMILLGFLLEIGMIVAMSVMEPLAFEVMFLVLGLVAAVLIAGYLGFRRAAYKRFFLKHIVRPAEESGIGTALVLARLDELARVGNLTGGIEHIVANRAVLFRLLAARGEPVRHPSGGTSDRLQKDLALPCVFTGLGVLVLLLAWVAGRDSHDRNAQIAQQAARLAPFQERVGEYLGANLPQHIDKPYLKGKVIAVDVNEKRIDEIYDALPADIRASAPEEVVTIVLLEWGKLKVGQYQPNNVDAIVLTCKATVIDKKRGLIVGEREFRGGDPPQRLERGGTNCGSKPTGPVVDWLKSLPRK